MVDCGGGTVDITVHEILNRQGNLKELYRATGGPYGSIGRLTLREYGGVTIRKSRMLTMLEYRELTVMEGVDSVTI